MANRYSIGQCSCRHVCVLRIRVNKDIKLKVIAPCIISFKHQKVLKGAMTGIYSLRKLSLRDGKRSAPDYEKTERQSPDQRGQVSGLQTHAPCVGKSFLFMGAFPEAS